ncbi:MAG: hypothetical protein KIS62_13465 [Ramlibacter sp.]|nr:hypothetical protein [Ramlibacter sp.]MCW5650750.1 hypothetical protein [Ramlibacter sp.]
MKKLLFTLTLLFPAFAAQAESTPAKKELVARILKVQQPAIEAMARTLAEQPAAAMMDRAAQVLSTRVAADKREAVARDIQADVKKYVDDAVPLVTDRALKLAPSTMGAVLEDKLSEEELRQVVAFIESPAYGKFVALGGSLQDALIPKLVTDTRSAIEPKVRALDQAIARRLGVTTPPSASPAAPAAPKPARPASK